MLECKARSEAEENWLSTDADGGGTRYAAIMLDHTPFELPMVLAVSAVRVTNLADFGSHHINI